MNATLPAANAAPFVPGIRPNITRADYDAVDAVRQSRLKHMRKSPAHYREAELRPDEPTAAQALGTAIHASLLEPERFRDGFVVMPDFTLGLVDAKGEPYANPRATKKYKADVAEFEAANAGKSIVDAKTKAICDGIAEAIAGNRVASELLTGQGANELGVFWTDADTDLACKALVDRVTRFEGSTVVVDIKSTTDASEWSFGRDCHTHGYYLQAAHYLAGLSGASTPISRRFMFIAVETAAPFAVAVYELDFESLAQGQRDLRTYLRTLDACRKADRWPGYADGVSTITLPRYAFTTDTEDDAHAE